MTVARLAYSAEAAEDLATIWLFVAAESPPAADAMLDRIEASCLRLLDFPLSGPARDDLRPGLRHLRVDQYLVVYRALDEAIQIVRVLHGKRDLDGLL